jgi:hypothetical protein
MSESNGKPVPWKDWSTARKALTIAQSVIQLTLLVAALADLSRRSKDEINGDKRRWYGIVFIAYVGPIIYFLYGRKKLPAQTVAETTTTA